MEWLVFALFLAVLFAVLSRPLREGSDEESSDPVNIVQRREEEE
jgi:hypothetical protein